MAAISTNFPDALDARIADIFDGDYKQLPDRIGDFFSIVGPGETPQKQDYRTSSIGAFADVPEFTGTVTYDDVFEGYDGTITPKEYCSGFQVERRLFDDDLTGIIEAKPRGMALAYARTRQKHGAQRFNNAFAVDSTWNSFTENVALCSNSHTTRSGASTASGFDNLITTALSTVALVGARIQMRGFRDDRGNRISALGTLLVIPVDLMQQAYELSQSAGVPELATNAANVNKGFKVADWEYLTDTNNWFLLDEALMKQCAIWYERLGYEFAMVEDFDTLVGKWRLYCRYGHGHRDWRDIIGAQVS